MFRVFDQCDFPIILVSGWLCFSPDRQWVGHDIFEKPGMLLTHGGLNPSFWHFDPVVSWLQGTDGWQSLSAVEPTFCSDFAGSSFASSLEQLQS